MRLPSDYLSKLTSLNSPEKAPNFNAVIQMVMQPFSDLQGFLKDLPQAFDLDEAIGVQLDIDGQWVGRSRHIAVNVPIPYFSFGVPNYGFGSGAPFHNPGQPRYSVVTYDLPDDADAGYGGFASYRNLLRAKIKANSWDGTNLGAVDALTAYFTDCQIFVADDPYRKLNVNVIFPWASAQSMAIPDFAIFSTASIPVKTAGVNFNYRMAVKGPVFGFGMNNDYCSGFGNGCWGADPQLYIDRWFGYNRPLSASGSCSLCGSTTALKGIVQLGASVLTTLKGKLK